MAMKKETNYCFFSHCSQSVSTTLKLCWLKTFEKFLIFLVLNSTVFQFRRRKDWYI